MRKIDNEYVLASYRKGIDNYKNASIDIGLWQSEAYVIKKYVDKQGSILDLGCGAGRTSFGMEDLGYTNISAIDLNPEMIEAALAIASERQSSTSFGIGDATDLEFSPGEFDFVLFSFNGIMSIPGLSKRQLAFEQISKVLKKGGIFIFTAHNREKDPKYFDFWAREKELWAEGKQNEELHEFGDILSYSEDVMAEIYIHIPTAQEIRRHLAKSGFEVLEYFFRPEKFTESKEVRAFSGECEFWVAKKSD